MDKKFILIHSKEHNCLDDSLASVAQTWGRRYELMFLKSWNFEYYPVRRKGDVIGKRLYSGCYMNWECLSDYHGIDYVWHNKVSAKEQLDILEEVAKSENRTVIIELDGYYVPWTGIYRKFHRKHYCIAFDMDKQEGIIKCYDPFWNEDINILPIRNFVSGKGVCTVLTKKDFWVNKNWKTLIRESLEILTGDDTKKAFEKAILEFADDVEKYFDPKNEFEGYQENTYISPLGMQLTELTFRRLGYSNVLKYLSKEYEVKELEKATKKMKEAGQGWLKVQKRIMKGLDMDNSKTYLAETASEIRRMAVLEKEIKTELVVISQ